jgi:hypothetical protein
MTIHLVLIAVLPEAGTVWFSRSYLVTSAGLQWLSQVDTVTWPARTNQPPRRKNRQTRSLVAKGIGRGRRQPGNDTGVNSRAHVPADRTPKGPCQK